MDSMAQSGDFEFTEENEKAIRAAYGPCGETTVADELGWTEEEEEEVNESGEGAIFTSAYAGMRRKRNRPAALRRHRTMLLYQ